MLKNPNPDFLPRSQEDEFLPPVSGWTIFGGIFLVGTVAIAFSVSAFTPLPVTVKASAVVRPNGGVKLVQAPSDGTVIGIDVKENDTVAQGKPLVTLDASRFSTRQVQLQGSVEENLQQLQQISEQLRNLNLQLNAEEERMKRAIASAEADFLRMQKDYNERRLTVQAQVNEARANLQVAEEEWQKAQSDIKASEASLRASQSALKIAQQKRDRYQKIGESALGKNQIEEVQSAVEQQQESVAERTALLQSQKQTVMRQLKAVESAKAKLQAVLATLNPSDGLVTMAKEKIAQEKAIGEASLARLNQDKNSLSQRKSELEKQLGSDRQELLQVQREISKTVVSAPISGVILKLNLRNPNQTVRMGEEIAQIAPSDTPLVIKARVSTEDIGKVKIGQKTQMRVSAYPYPDYGILQGTVMTISPDAIIPQNTGANPILPYYEVTIQPDQLYLKDDRKNALQSGMEIQADIIAKNETVLKFILRKARLFTDL
ncbi:HlyD family efflux transporter periplasmic adaptor subunit [Phormidium sp. LEGE 05292]|uniref:HlyD family efflux transporter periplasmic adaptor subunit n=1 Tax=[Phormidium] sp. LEGE 05292 TaxID=767427 RepID=UPI00188268A5|nr:HlyD family efflux transporter periplasmic adaptor subunit [Phormidium sp. LEGE 05292]MBE9227853.1 HlyD family efflux transporter periplasmic adaptor subunit [Phormidium sp. LEGE 05292]